MCRWTVIALVMGLCLSAAGFSAALPPALSPDSGAHDSAAAFSPRSAHAAGGAFAAFGFWIYDAMSQAFRWVGNQLQPVFRAVSRFFKEVFGEPYDENTILRVPLSRRP
jgi:hypothetical protein